MIRVIKLILKRIAEHGWLLETDCKSSFQHALVCFMHKFISLFTSQNQPKDSDTIKLYCSHFNSSYCVTVVVLSVAIHIELIKI